MTYAYREMAGGANDSRPTSMSYPDWGSYPPPYWSARSITYNHSSGLNDSISRLSSLSDSSGTLETHFYVGAGTADIINQLSRGPVSAGGGRILLCEHRIPTNSGTGIVDRWKTHPSGRSEGPKPWAE